MDERDKGQHGHAYCNVNAIRTRVAMGIFISMSRYYCQFTSVSKLGSQAIRSKMALTVFGQGALYARRAFGPGLFGANLYGAAGYAQGGPVMVGLQAGAMWVTSRFCHVMFGMAATCA